MSSEQKNPTTPEKDNAPETAETPETVEKEEKVTEETPVAEEAVEEPKKEAEEATTEAESTEEPADEKEPLPEPEEELTPQRMLELIDPSLAGANIEVRDGEKFIKLEDVPPDSEYTSDEEQALSAMYDGTFADIKENEIVTGRIVAISEKEVAVDINFKSEGTVPIEEFADVEDLKVGDEIEVFLDTVEDSEGQLQLSKKKADFMRVWSRVKGVYESDGIIIGRCIRRIKGGMVVDLGGVDAFLPGSQIDVRPVRDFESLINTEMEFRILKINDLRKNVVISHKVLVEESLREVREKLLSKLEVGDVLEGTVKNITDFGVFVDLGGVDGLLHITDLSWGRVTHPSEIVQLDQKIKVKVLSYDEDRRRISLGLKQLYTHLWDEINKKYVVGQKVQGKIVSLAKYGAFVEIEPGIEGLVHISEMSWTQHVKHPSQIVHENEFIQVVILNIDKDNRKISLGLKQVEEDPWEKFEAKYRENTQHKGTVRDLVPFGAFIELEDGIDGLIHISDLSWTKKIRHPGEMLKKGQEIEVVVLAFDRDERRIALGYKQLEDNPWELFEREQPVNSKTTGVVTRVIDKGVLVELPRKLEGFVPNSQISKRYYEGKKRKIQLGDILKLVVIEFDKEERKVVLSNSQAEQKEEQQQSSSYARKTQVRGSTLADSLEEDNPLLQAYKAAKAEEKAAKKKTKKTDSKPAEDVKAEEPAEEPAESPEEAPEAKETVKAEKADKAEKAEKAEEADKADEAEKADDAEKVDETDKAEKADEAEEGEAKKDDEKTE